MDKDDLIPIGTLAQRTGISVSAIRFYEDRGLIFSERTDGNQRRFRRSDIRRLSFILIAQRLGLGLDEIEQTMDQLPRGRTPNIADWRRISVRKLGFSAFGTPRELEVETIANNSGVSLEAVTLYWLDDEIFADPVSMKLSQTRLRLLGERPRGGVFILAAPAANSLDGARAIQSLLSDIEPLSAWLARIDARIES